MVALLNQNAGAVTALATLAILLVTGFYAWTTFLLFREAKESRLLAGQPRVVTYLRVHPVHSNIVQLCVANLSGAAAIDVTLKLDKVTEWPVTSYLENSSILRDLSYLRPHEVLNFDLGVGPDLFRDEKPAIFQARAKYASTDGRTFDHEAILRVESVAGHSHFQIYGIDDIARRLTEIRDILKGYTGFNRLAVNAFSAKDRQLERQQREEERRRFHEKKGKKDSQ